MPRKNLVIILISGFLIFVIVSTATATKITRFEGAPAGFQAAMVGDTELTRPNDEIALGSPPELQLSPEDLGVGPTAYDVEDIRAVQIILKNRGYDPGNTNGMLSSQTKQAIMKFQAANNLPVTGQLDQQTQKALGVSIKGTSLLNTESVRIKPVLYQPPNPTTRNPAASSNTVKTDKEATERIAKAASVLQALTGTEDKRIPTRLLERAEAVLVIPDMVKGAFGIGGRYGKGVASQRSADGRWGPPAFVQIGGGSFGAQIGVSSTDLVLVFTDRRALDLLDNGKDLKLGVDASIAAGPIGRSAEAGVNAGLDTAIYAYSRSKGLFAGVALDGAVLDLDDSMNKKVYGESVSVRNILNGKTSMNATVRPFVDTLERVAPRKKIS